ncbi:ABC transporter substrate-binding protein [Curvivirga aplysinae]|uniref:ABC transporter substrate-binding protein n=1 Tax=Curvivirga aplysinae TaxID=2529852 RepID=UPI001F2D21FD|nr:ABC transporter substrate-binding protein [Curvivirga aplysinae]
MKMGHGIRKATFGLAGLAMCIGASASAWANSSDPIKLTLHDWTGQLLTTKIMGEVLKKGGFNVEYVQADYIAQFAGLQSGDLHVAMEIWETTGREAMDKAVGTGKVENLGSTGMQAIEEWWYPSYMEERCPGLPNWEALNDCAEEFGTAETLPNGRYLGAPVTWGGFDDERVEALELDYEVVHAGTDAALFAELESAYQREAPILLWVYSPHWATFKFQGDWIQFPEYSAECYNDPSVGVNPDLAYDCGKPTGPIWKVAWSGVKDKWPGAHSAIESFDMNNDEMSALIVKADLNGEDIDDVVQGWITENKDVWKEWLK